MLLVSFTFREVGYLKFYCCLICSFLREDLGAFCAFTGVFIAGLKL
jgi:hypothetical protein